MYSKTNFEADIQQLNKVAKLLGLDIEYVPGYRYSYAAVDYRRSNTPKYCLTGTICTAGTKREMIAEARADLINRILNDESDFLDMIEEWGDMDNVQHALGWAKIYK